MKIRATLLVLLIALGGCASTTPSCVIIYDYTDSLGCITDSECEGVTP